MLQLPLREVGEAIKALSTSLFNMLQLLPSALIRREHPAHSCNNSRGRMAPLTAASLLAGTGTAEFLLLATKALADSSWLLAGSPSPAPQHSTAVPSFPHDSQGISRKAACILNEKHQLARGLEYLLA